MPADYRSFRRPRLVLFAGNELLRLERRRAGAHIPAAALGFFGFLAMVSAGWQRVAAERGRPTRFQRPRSLVSL